MSAKTYEAGQTVYPVADWRDDPIARAGVANANMLLTKKFPKGTRLRGVKGGFEVTEPTKATYFLPNAGER